MEFRSANTRSLTRFRAWVILCGVLMLGSMSADAFTHVGEVPAEFGQDHICVTCQIGQLIGPVGSGHGPAIQPPAVIPVRDAAVSDGPSGAAFDFRHRSRAPPTSL